MVTVEETTPSTPKTRRTRPAGPEVPPRRSSRLASRPTPPPPPPAYTRGRVPRPTKPPPQPSPRETEPTTDPNETNCPPTDDDIDREPSDDGPSGQSSPVQGEKHIQLLIYIKSLFDLAFLFKVAVLAVSAWICWIAWEDWKQDVKQLETTRGTEINQCLREFGRNRCDSPVPAAEMACHEWEQCMVQNPRHIDRVGAMSRTVSHLFQGLWCEVGWPSMVFCCVVLLAFAWILIRRH